ncbi:alpha/beta hydrolase fold domain-containing protein [Skermanella rosea]|uniref:alpha/beta hydrolase fold domain-containing protein n=1 Tax=Skermanella rosea TaxID=1817965 RepID=UPI001931667F|nr:alpha/beta hydrolase fold domain-containing protein [Skermanella rosea]UEM06267.1 alpha/beta hydrolase fold domain-containing protein [Skermanella rosea]
MALPPDRFAPGVAEALRIAAARTPATGGGIAALRDAYETERSWWNRPVIDLHSVTDTVLDLEAGPTGVRVYRPDAGESLPGLVFLHGGGFVVGSLDSHDRIMRQLCRRSGAVVVGLDYPLSPEHRYPAALDTVEQAVVALAEGLPVAGIDPGRLGIGGDSAGAHLALAAALRLRDRRPDAVRFMLLYYGLYGLEESESRRRYTDPVYGLPPDELRFYEACYLGPGAPPGGDAMDLLAADLAGLPPAFVGAAALDPLRDDSLALADSLRRAGGRAELRVYDGVPHGFLHWSRLVPTAVQALEDGARAAAATLFRLPS